MIGPLPTSSISRIRVVSYATVASMVSLCLYVLAQRAPAAEYIPDVPLPVYHVIGDFAGASSAARPFRTWLQEYVNSGAPGGHSGITWEWMEIQSRVFFEEILENETLPAGSLVVVDNAALFKAEKEVMDAVEIAGDPIKRALRLWALLNNSEPLTVILHNDNACDTPWLNTTHHIVYRDVWCDRYHADWQASQAAERSSGARAGWLRSLPFGSGLDGGHLTNLTAERRPSDQRRLLVQYRGTLAYRKPSRELLYRSAQDQVEPLRLLAARLLGHKPLHPSGVGRLVIEARGAGYEFDPINRLVRPAPQTGHGVHFSEPFATEKRISQLELLRDSIYTLCPPADTWADYCVYDAMEAGSFPVVVRNQSYKGCDAPHEHLLATAPGVLAIESWDQLAEALAAATPSLTQLVERQQSMLAWVATEKRRAFSGLLAATRLQRRCALGVGMARGREGNADRAPGARGAATGGSASASRATLRVQPVQPCPEQTKPSARASPHRPHLSPILSCVLALATPAGSGKWRERTTCSYEPLHWSVVGWQHKHLATYWRRPQPRKDDAWNVRALRLQAAAHLARWALSTVPVARSHAFRAGWPQPGWPQHALHTCAALARLLQHPSEITPSRVHTRRASRLSPAPLTSPLRPWQSTSFWAYLTGKCPVRPDGWCEDLHDGDEDPGGIGRCFQGPGCFCESDSENWRERCLTTGCGLDLAASFECRAVPAPPPTPSEVVAGGPVGNGGDTELDTGLPAPSHESPADGGMVEP